MPLLSEKRAKSGWMLCARGCALIILQHRIFSTTFIPARRISIQNGISASQLKIHHHRHLCHHRLPYFHISSYFMYYLLFNKANKMKPFAVPDKSKPDAIHTIYWQLILLYYAFVIHMKSRCILSLNMLIFMRFIPFQSLSSFFLPFFAQPVSIFKLYFQLDLCVSRERSFVLLCLIQNHNR